MRNLDLKYAPFEVKAIQYVGGWKEEITLPLWEVGYELVRKYDCSLQELAGKRVTLDYVTTVKILRKNLLMKEIAELESHPLFRMACFAKTSSYASLKDGAIPSETPSRYVKEKTVRIDYEIISIRKMKPVYKTVLSHYE